MAFCYVVRYVVSLQSKQLEFRAHYVSLQNIEFDRPDVSVLDPDFSLVVYEDPLI